MKVVVNVDGGARGNPGPAAVAAVATSPDGDALGAEHEPPAQHRETRDRRRPRVPGEFPPLDTTE